MEVFKLKFYAVKIFLVFASIVLVDCVRAFDGAYILDSYTNADTVIDICISSNGHYLWSVTHGGLVRWNVQENTFEKHTTMTGLHDNWHLSGTRNRSDTFFFGSRSAGISFNTDDSWSYWKTETSAIPYNEILAINMDPLDRLWASFGAAFGNGLGILENGHWTFITTADGLSHNKINAISTDIAGAWIGTVNGLNRITNGTVTNTFNTDNGLPDNAITALVHDDSTVWVGTRLGLAKIFENTVTVFTTGNGLPANHIQCLYLDISGVLHIGTPDGAATYNNSNQHFAKISALISLDIRVIRSGNDGTMFYGVYGEGIYVLQHDGHKKIYSTGDKLPGNDVRAVAYHDGKTWFGTNGQGTGWFDGTDWWIDTTESGAGSAQIRHIVIDHDETIWFSTFDKGVFALSSDGWTHHHKDYGLPVNAVISGYVDRDNNKWFATWGGGIVRYDNTSWSVIDENDGLPTNITYAVEQDSTGVYWFALDDGIISYSNGHFLDFYTEADGLVYHRVYDITVNPFDNSLWIGACRGMSHLKDNQFTNYLPGPEQLNHYRIRSIVIDNTENVWIATGNGINVFSHGIFHSITSLDGLAGYEVYGMTIDDNENIWIGTPGGLTHITVNDSDPAKTGAAVTMPSSMFFPGDVCRVDLVLTNASETLIETIPVYILLDVYGEYFFGPGYTHEPDNYFIDSLAPGTVHLEIVPDFFWPSGAGEAESIRWLSAMTTADRKNIIGEIGEWVFGWRE